MSDKFRVFVSSVQKELEDERLTIKQLISTDQFLKKHCVPILYELEPASPRAADEECIKHLDGCQIYLLMVGVEYGKLVDELSITHTEYRRAKEKGLSRLVFIKGDRHLEREAGTMELLNEVAADGLKYKRFSNVIELQKEVRDALVSLLEDYGVVPTNDENMIAEQTIEATSTFESQLIERIRWQDLDHEVARRLISAAENILSGELSEEDLLAGSIMRGLVWRDKDSDKLLCDERWHRVTSQRPLGCFPSVSHPCRCVPKYRTRL